MTCNRPNRFFVITQAPKMFKKIDPVLLGSQKSDPMDRMAKIMVGRDMDIMINMDMA